MVVRIDRRCRRLPSHPSRWRQVVLRAIPRCHDCQRGADVPLSGLDEVTFVLVSDRVIARIHQDFMNDPTPTDVITFHHGEVIISLETAQRQAKEYGEDYEREVARYMIHGLLHLAGWEDYDPAERQEMHHYQEAILAEVWNPGGQAA